MEEHLNQLISNKNKSSELENQHRHLMKRREAYQLSDEFINKFKRKKWDVNKTKRKIEYLSDILVQMYGGKKLIF